MHICGSSAYVPLGFLIAHANDDALGNIGRLGGTTVKKGPQFSFWISSSFQQVSIQHYWQRSPSGRSSVDSGLGPQLVWLIGVRPTSKRDYAGGRRGYLLIARFATDTKDFKHSHRSAVCESHLSSVLADNNFNVIVDHLAKSSWVPVRARYYNEVDRLLGISGCTFLVGMRCRSHKRGR